MLKMNNEKEFNLLNDHNKLSPLLDISYSNIFPSLTSSQLLIIGQKIHSEETISKNGIKKPIFIVVKNSPFYFTIGSINKIDFNQIAFEAFLYYDCEENKEVDFVKIKPLEFKSTPNENGQQLNVELRIKVLSSQHEDMLFKVKIQGFNPITKEIIDDLYLFTPGIKVISKPEQIKKKQQQPSKKRTLTDMLMETVKRIEQKQNEQQQLIEKILKVQTKPISSILEENKDHHELHSLTSNDSKNKVPDFEESFIALIKAYNSLKAEEKPEIIRKLVHNSSTRNIEKLTELLDLFWTEGLQYKNSFHERELDNNFYPPNFQNRNNNFNEECSCNECPHKLELERIDEFYREFLSIGNTNMSNFSC